MDGPEPVATLIFIDILGQLACISNNLSLREKIYKPFTTTLPNRSFINYLNHFDMKNYTK